ncbi:hypothetical protein HPB51_029418 [Rhipicephalus microplus]|uniref:Alanine--glyoxylate aminotransferase 2, mitochondrial n=1 Tax=Rhipicephalus microplus TaxID=6941 RepID=A0A9J6CU81_RHIMP|nr:hypothetical protein HPB51_029418 [Rhipicephalus microplus]
MVMIGLSTKLKEIPGLYRNVNVDDITIAGEGKPWAEVVALRKSHLNPSLSSNLLYKEPLLLTQGHMQWLWDHKGKRYLDMFAGIVTVSVGHCHPKVVAAAEKQLKQLWHTSNVYLYPTVHEFAEKLAEKMPGDLKVR